MKKTKKSILIFLVLLISFSPVSSSSLLIYSQADEEDEYYEEISGYQEWTENKTIAKTINVNPGATLVVKNGVTLTIENGGSINIEGNMVISGTMKSPVIIKKAEDAGNYAITVQESGKLVMRNADVSGGGYGMYGFEKKSLFNTAIAYGAVQGAICIAGGWLDVEGSSFHDNTVAISVDDQNVDRIKVNRSKFFDNDNYDVYYSEDSGEIINFKYNWWGREDGPEKNCESDGECWYVKLERAVNVSNWLTEPDFRDPVIIIPGILGSQEVFGIRVLDPIFGTYDSLFKTFEGNGYDYDENLFTFPYEWHDSNIEKAQMLAEKIRDIKGKNNWPKVDIVAHSMGGLLAREYIESDYYQNDVDQLITLGTPHNGAPEDYLAWDGGEFGVGKGDYILERIFKQEAEENGYSSIFDYIRKRPIDSVQELLPTYDYLYSIADDSMRKYPTFYPTNSFLENLNASENILKLNMVEFINIVGKLTDNESTITSIRVEKPSIQPGSIWEHGIPENYTSILGDHGLEKGEGDGTVPFESASGIRSNEMLEKNFAHRDLPGETSDEVYEILTGEVPEHKIDYVKIGKMLIFFVFSPVDIQVIETKTGKWAGKNIRNLDENNQITGAYYTGYDGIDNEFLTVPNPTDGEYEIVTEGTSNGDYKIEAAKITEEASGQAKESAVEISGTATTGETDNAKIEVKEDEVILDREEDPVDIASIIQKVQGYYDSKLITKIEKNFLEVHLKSIQNSFQVLEKLENNQKMKPKAKEIAIKVLKRGINFQIDYLIKRLESKHMPLKKLNEEIRTELVEDLGEIKPAV